MLINTIKFDIHDFQTGKSEEYLVENNAANYQCIAGHRFTRNIRFESLFDFQFEREFKMPKFLEFAEAVALAFVENYDVFEIDSVDEMTGCYA